MNASNQLENSYLYHDFEDFFEKTRIGYIITDLNGKIIRNNQCIGDWLDAPSKQLRGRYFSDILSIGGRIFYGTHLQPLLRMQGHFDEVSLDLACDNGNKLKVTLHGYERRDENEKPLFIRFAILKANDRHAYEQNLRQGKLNAEQNLSTEKEFALLREQFIAVLGHDLRNPLASISMGAELLKECVKDEELLPVINILKRGAARMNELITNVMDFAKTRMGDGIGINFQSTDIIAVFEQVVGELQLAFPERNIRTDLKIQGFINCDGFRLSQLLSNLLANALTHGSKDTPVWVKASMDDNELTVSVSNSGNPISPEALKKLFLPFQRETTRPSRQGLGLGLYIASEIARGHKGELNVTSNTEETKFTFTMRTNANGCK